MTTNAFRHRPPEQCTLSKEDQQHILRISNNDQELLDELMVILRQLRPLPPRGASVRHTTVDVTDARNDQAGRQTHRWSVFRSLITGQSVSSNSSPPESISSLRLRTTDNLKKRRATKLHSTASCDHQIECVPHFTHVCLSAYPTPGAIQPGACRFALAGCARLLSP